VEALRTDVPTVFNKCVAQQSTVSCGNSYLPLQSPFLKWY